MRLAVPPDLASKRCKRRKLNSAGQKDVGLSASGNGEAQQRECYLDRLPYNVLENVIRLMSSSPRSSAWAEQLEDSDICTLFSLGGEMELAARECFRSLSFDAQPKGSHRGYQRQKFHLYRLNILSTNMSNATLMNLASPSYTALVIRDPPSNLFGQPVDLGEFLRKCPNVKGLDICSDNTRTWVEKLGPRLERLQMHVSSPSICRSISSYCTQLRELYIREAHMCAVGRSDLWEKIGATLEKLYVTFVCSASEEIRKIQQYCRKIRWLDISVEERVNPTLADCIVSYGEQLEHAFLSNMDQSQLEAIVTACPNAKFHISIIETSHTHSLKVLGSRLEKVVLLKHEINNFCSLAKGWNECLNIETVVCLDKVSLSYARAMFTEPKPALRELEIEIGFAEDLSVMMNILDCVAEGTGALRRLTVITVDLADGMFDKLVARNQALQEFVCNAEYCEDDEMCDVPKMAEGLLKLPKLTGCWIHLDDDRGISDDARKKLEEVVRPHRHRLLVVEMIGRYYLH